MAGVYGGFGVNGEETSAKFSETLLPEIGYLYRQAIEKVEQFDDDTPQGGISAKEVLRAHFCVVDYFLREGGEGVGGYGPKDIGMLLSAISRQHSAFGGTEKWSTVFEKAATLIFGLVMNHPFYDGNKRTAYLSTIHYLFSNGHAISVSQKALEDLTVDISERNLNRFSRYREFKKRSDDPEIDFLAWYFRKNTHQVDKRQYLVTYRELEKLLKKYQVVLVNPSNNYIDVMRWEQVTKRKGIFGKPTTQPELRKVCSLGFPGWSKVVGKGRLRHIRSELGLMPEDGVDAQAFFYDVDDMRVLIDLYEGALRRLAYR